MKADLVFLIVVVAAILLAGAAIHGRRYKRPAAGIVSLFKRRWMPDGPAFLVYTEGVLLVTISVLLLILMG